jgi:outer membrane receptor protein involved in Fe transport
MDRKAHLMPRRLLLACCALAIFLRPVAAQERGESTEPGEITGAAFQGEQPEGTLPPLDVRPPEGDPAEGTLPPVDVSPPSTSFPEFDSEPPYTSLSYPSLTELDFGESGRLGANTGILRNQTSIFDTPAAASIRTREEILERQAPDMFHALQNEVGVLIQSTAAGQASPFIRGLTGQQVLILVDGIRLNNSITRRGPNQYFNTIDPGMVDHIEVLRGQGSVLWGSDAIGGAINVVTRGADPYHGMRCGDYSSNGFTQYYNTSSSSPYSRLNIEGWMGSTGIFGGGSYLDVNDLDTGYDNFTRQPGTSYQQYAGDMKFNYLLDDYQMLTVSLQHLEQEDLPRSDRYPGYPFDRNNSNTFGDARFFDPQQRDLAYLRYQGLDPLGGMFDAFTFTASYNRQREVQTRGVPTTRYQETDVETTGLQGVVSRDFGAFGRLIAGVDWYYDDVDSPFGGAASGPIVPDDAWYRRAGCFMNWDVPLTDRLSASAGWRYESIETAGTPLIMDTPVYINPSYDDLIGQIGLLYELDPSVHLVGSISEGFRAPNLDDLMANNPNVLQQGQSLPSLGLSPENSISYEAGIKTNFQRFRSQTFVYWMDLQDNMVSITAAPNTFETANQDSYINGVECDGEFLLRDGWSLYGNCWYTHGKNRVTSAPLSRIPPLQGIAGLRYRQANLRSYFTLYTWMSDRQDRLDPVRDVTDERIPIGGTPGFATLNMRFGRTLGSYDQHRLSLSLENLTDKDYLVHGSGLLGTGFTARFGYSWLY